MVEVCTTFGGYFKQRRIELRKTLRQFCREHNLDPGNISRLERGKLAPPQKESILRRYAQCLQLDDAEWQEFKELAEIGAGKIPEYLSDTEVLPHLPLFFRTLKDSELSAEKLRELIEKIRES